MLKQSRLSLAHATIVRKSDLDYDCILSLNSPYKPTNVAGREMLTKCVHLVRPIA
ncbi:MAG: hypothetical protein J5I90_16175 [Caldilineales bacterium]|nr:hypothetical protein [Caldilineales bacterium]